jgi:hypothetical protein
MTMAACGWRLGKFWRESPLWRSLVQVGRRDNFFNSCAICSSWRGPSWLTLIAHAKDSVWSVDLFRVESILLRRREYLDRVFFWKAVDLTRKLKEYEDYYNAYRVHRSLGGTTPVQCSAAPASLDRHAWRHIAVVCFRPRSPLD